VFLTSCGQTVDQNTSLNIPADSSEINEVSEQQNQEPDTEQLRKEYISNYKNIETIDTSFANSEGNQIHVQTKYYCLFDNAIVVPKQYVWEETTQTFTTHNYVHEVKIVIDNDTIFNKTIAKADFSDKLAPELKKYAVLMFPNFSYDKEKRIFDFGYSLSIPVTDVGAGWRLFIDKKGNLTKTDS